MKRRREGILAEVKFDRRGLVTAIVQGGFRGRVLMVAYMNREALKRTLKTGLAHFYSRSRSRIWKKGEESGHVQRVNEIRIDCDGDAVLLVVRQAGGGACHLGYRSCFFRKAGRGRWRISERKSFDPRSIYRPR